MDECIADELEPQVKKVVTMTKSKLESFKNFPRIILLGNTGSGKSTLTCSLTDQKTKVIEKDGFRSIEGNGIISGTTSGTREPSVYTSQELQLNFCDLPGFKDTGGMKQEIKNSFANDCMFDSSNGDVYFKILIVVSDSNLKSDRGEGIQSIFQRLEKMFPDIEEFKDKIGLVITQGSNNGINYIKALNDRPSDYLRKWCDYYLTDGKDNIFTLPKPSRESIGKQYEFEDKDRLMDFVKNDYIINPSHNITLDDTSMWELKNLKDDHNERFKRIIGELFDLINDQYRKENNSNTFGTWLNIMHNLLDKNIRKSKDFGDAIKELIPNSEQYLDYFIMLEEFEDFDTFVYKVLEIGNDSCLQETFRFLAHDSIMELENSLLQAKQTEINDIHKAELDEKNREFQSIYDQNKASIEQLKATIEQQNINSAQQSAKIRELERRLNPPPPPPRNYNNNRCNIY